MSKDMERLTKKFTDGTFYCEDIEDVGIDGINAPTYVGKAVSKLADYEDAEEQGLLIKLPCKIGDSIYQPIRNVINEYKVIGICYDIEKNKWLFEVAYQLGLEWFKTVCEFKAIGKTVFLAKEEAEQALKQMGE